MTDIKSNFRGLKHQLFLREGSERLSREEKAKGLKAQMRKIQMNETQNCFRNKTELKLPSRDEREREREQAVKGDHERE
jgi:hypothetical protein